MKTRGIAIAVASAAMVVTSFAAPAAASSQHTKAIAACTKAQYKPTKYVLTCADFYTQIHHASYASWSAKFARGHGRYVYNTCHPDCADGHTRHHPVTFDLYQPRTVRGQRLFTRMDVSYAGLTETFDLPTKPI